MEDMKGAWYPDHKSYSSITDRESYTKALNDLHRKQEQKIKKQVQDSSEALQKRVEMDLFK